MTFDKSMVYTSLNAEELEIGDEVILANDLNTLKYKVEVNSWPMYVVSLGKVLEQDHIHRFEAPDSRAYNLAYLVGRLEKADIEKENCIVYLQRYDEECWLSTCYECEWKEMQEKQRAKTKLFVGTESEVEEWRKSRQKFAKVIKAWEDGKEIQFRKQGTTSWAHVDVPKWYTDCEYRAKPDGLLWTDLKVGDVLVENAGDGMKEMVVAIDPRPSVRPLHVCLGGMDWIDDEDLKEWRKAE